MLIEHEVSGDIDEIIKLFGDSPKKAERAIGRTITKLSRWSEREVLRDMSHRMNVTVKLLKGLQRIKVRLNKSYGRKERYLTIWIGINEVGAHKLGKPVQDARGTRVGRNRYDSAFLMQPVEAPYDLIWRRAEDWVHKYRLSKKSKRWMWMGLPLVKMTKRIDYDAEAALKNLQPRLVDKFLKLLHQELNDAFNIES